HSGFIVDVQSANNTDRVNIYIYNAEGKVKEKLTINANTRFEVGNNYPAGLYFTEVTQGKQRQVIRLLKLN
ncbi:MAG TPA: T9SS type A sorting domain-containing protein, partial [Flavisolibacter sp.]|nr:T9SS type A sorting domain-containing protein [Flavisolibacter sp.]